MAKVWLLRPLPWRCAKCGENEVRNMRVEQSGVRVYTCHKCHYQHFSEVDKVYSVEWDEVLQRGLVTEVCDE